MIHHLAADFGASSGRILRGDFDGTNIRVSEIHRFPNYPVRMRNRLYWDFPRLFYELQCGLRIAGNSAVGSIQTLGIDTWGLDGGFIGSAGELLVAPRNYRDPINKDGFDYVRKVLSDEYLFRKTGIQLLQINTIYQLAIMKKEHSYVFDFAQAFLMMPDLFHSFLTGIIGSEYTIATTTQLLNADQQNWDVDILKALHLNRDLFTDIIHPGTRLGKLLPSVAKEVNLPDLEVIAVATHDTASAVLSVPVLENSSAFMFISCGTWSLVGAEIPQPIINEKTLAYNMSNEGGVFGTIRLLKNVMGLWLLQETRREWVESGLDINFKDMVDMAEQASPFLTMFDPDDPCFLEPGHMMKRIQSWCLQRKLPVPQEKGEIIRCILESLAFKFCTVLKQLEDVLGNKMNAVYIVGGGVNNSLLCQFTANATGIPVIAGSSEATGIGNILMQLYAKGELKDLSEIRLLVQQSFPIQVYEPQNIELWEENYQKFISLISERIS
ncbi:rhamnulokinase [Fodinisporobacter ferrooxydans]|uniref:Rhamnulokinase n=1 Tax=Fodinisporobacter ferrooxydans TaxID=2901836 RepID=A0ABY4CJE9_9BACL|nr:rhamnulokinase [Alicyclobacillaceae bacterium MYW30-H2]